MWWFAFRGIKVAAQPPSLCATMHTTYRAHIGPQHALAITKGTAVMIASVGKVLLDHPLAERRTKFVHTVLRAQAHAIKECACMQSHAWCDIVTRIDKN